MRFRVAEIFGPTIQGEGRNVGIPCHFVRFGGCDFRCSWCDTPHAVLPEMVRQLPKVDEYTIYRKVASLPSDARWVVFTGGNPALLSLSNLIDIFHKGHFKVMLETQGSVYRDWFSKIDDLCFSPKPPSAGNTTDLDNLERIFDRMVGAPYPYLKVPIFTDEDLDYAEDVVARFAPEFEVFLSIGNDDPALPTVANPWPTVTYEDQRWTTAKVLDNFEMVLSKVLDQRPKLQQCQIFPQQHVLLWGNERGH
jgi:7-carboxy-7-deazaguanine synthase